MRAVYIEAASFVASFSQLLACKCQIYVFKSRQLKFLSW